MSLVSVSVEVAVSILVWGVLVLYLGGTLVWGVEMMFISPRYEKPDATVDLADVQVRIVTIDAESVVQRTVDALPEELVDRHVIAEEPLSVEGATVHVVPDAFECEATRKGRALEWARRHVDCDREYVLYLDEDSLVTNLEALPPGDIVQLRELPYRTGSRLTYFAEIFRLGFQAEQRAFTQFAVPLYAWGGGIVVRKELEDAVTWNFDTIIEDTVFAWRAALNHDADFELAQVICRNQSPPTMTEMAKQRRRWLAGSKQESSILPARYWAAFWLRNLTWGLSPVVPFLPFVTFLFPGLIIYESAYLSISLFLFLVPLIWSVTGYLSYGESIPVGLAAIVLTPITTIVHSVGALLGLVSAPVTFDSTRKVDEANYLPDVDDISASAVTTPFAPSEDSLARGSPVAWLAGITTLGLGLRLYELTESSLWVDEIYSVTFRSSLPFIQLLTAKEAHPPLYYTWLKYWMGIFGKSILATRLLSVLIGVASIVAIYYLGRELYDTEGGLVAALLLSLSTYHIHTSQTVRMYELLSLLTIVSTYYFVRMLRSDRQDATFLYAVTTWLLLLSHLFGALIVLAQNVYYGWLVARDRLFRDESSTSTGGRAWSRFKDRLRTDGGASSVNSLSQLGGGATSRPTLKRWIVVQSVVGLLYLGFFLQILPRLLLADSGGRGSNVQWLSLPDVQIIWRTFAAFVGQPLQYPLLAYGPQLHLMAVATLGVSVVAITGLFATWRWEGGRIRLYRDVAPNAGISLALLGVCLLTPIVLSYLITPMYAIRYAAPASIGFVLLVAGGITNVENRSVKALLLGTLVLTSAAFVGVYHTTETREQWDEAVTYVEGNLNPDDLVVLTPGWINSSVEYHGLPADVTTVKYTTERERFASVKTNHDTVWVIRRSPQPVEPVRTSLQETHTLTETRRFGAIVVYRFDRG